MRRMHALSQIPDPTHQRTTLGAGLIERAPPALPAHPDATVRQVALAVVLARPGWVAQLLPIQRDPHPNRRPGGRDESWVASCGQSKVAPSAHRTRHPKRKLPLRAPLSTGIKATDMVPCEAPKSATPPKLVSRGRDSVAEGSTTRVATQEFCRWPGQASA